MPSCLSKQPTLARHNVLYFGPQRRPKLCPPNSLLYACPKSDRPVQFLGVCLIFLRPIRIPFFPQLDLGSIKSPSNFTRPLKIAEITKRSFHAESNIIDGRPNDLAYVYLIEISLSFSFYFILFVADRSPKKCRSLSVRKWKRGAEFCSVREFLSLPFRCPIENMPQKENE